MFRSARLKLTGWYLLIIMLVSISFSVVIYRVLTSEVTRFSALQRTRIERRLLDQGLLPPGTNINNAPPPVEVDTDLMTEVEYRIILRLVIVNGIILIISGGLGYVLAGQTLKPIAEMVDEQNQFISDASHELRTPLTALKTSMEVNIRDKKLTTQNARELLKDSVSQVNKLQKLSDSLLQLTQYQQINDQSRRTKEKLLDIVNNAYERIAPMAKSKQIAIVRTIGNLSVTCDKERFIDLFVILLDNAVKYSPPNTTVTISAKRTDGHIVLHVIDEGIGIAAKDIPHIFDRFYRADTARTQKDQGGYGLGLSIAKKIIQAHHGFIGVKSTLGKGSNFIIQLPA